MGKEEEEALPRAEQLLPDSKKYPPRVDRRKKEKKKRTENFVLHLENASRWPTEIYVVGNDQFNMRMRKEKKRRRLGNGWWRRPAGERSRFRMNE
jgi:hypothetical protein